MTCTFRWCEMSGHFHCRNDPGETMKNCTHDTVDAISGRCAYCQHRVDPPAALPAPSAEPTTAEAFARVRHEIASHTDTEENIAALDALALLERRMQELEGSPCWCPSPDAEDCPSHPGSK